MTARPVLRPAPIASARVGLGLLSHGLHRDILRELVERGALTRSALAARLHTSATKVHECLRRLQEAGVVCSRRRGRAVEYSITTSGRELHATTAIVTRWSRAHPERPLTPSVGWRAFADLGESWRMALFEWLVRCAPAEEDIAAGFGGYEPGRLRDTLEAMREARMIARRKGRDGRGRDHLTSWAARGIGILAAIARWEERQKPPGYAAVEVGDAVVALRAALPLVRLEEDVAGICTFAAEAQKGQVLGPRLGTVWARIRRGRVVGIGEGAPPEQPAGWVIGTFGAWLSVALDGRRGALRLSGRDEVGVGLVAAVVDEIHAQLMLFDV